MDLLRVPTFARIDEYASVWCMEPIAFRAFWDAVARMDLIAHIQEEPPPLKSQMEMTSGSGKQVALIPVLGTLMKQRSSLGGTSTIQLRRDIRQAAADPNVTAILLAFDSPGGTVAGTDDLASEVRNAKQVKPVWAHVDDLCASAAFWVASQTDAIYANSPTALIGSIGTLMTVYDQSAAAEQSGIKAMAFTTGPLKASGVPGTHVTDEQASYFQGIVNNSQQQFDLAVQSGRELSDAQLASVRSGAVFGAADAKRLKLIDGIQPLSKTLDMLGRHVGKKTGVAAALPMVRRGLPMLT